MEYVAGATGGLDNYSTYLTEAQLDDVYSQIEGNFVGLGIELKAEGESLNVMNVIEGSPAQRAGMQAGDVIIAVDGKTTAAVTTDKAADMLKGTEGTTVDVTLRAPSGEVRTLRVRRERVEVPSVEKVAIIDRDNGIGYLKISSFQKTTVRDLDAALWKLHRDGMRSLIIDVRGNPGGLLTASVEAADRFVEQGTIVSTRGRISSEDFDYKAHRVGTWRVPLFVLIDGDSASASEIFAGAIHDLQRGLVIGERSYGKGSVQGIFPLGTARSGVRLTTAKFYSPSGRAISLQGVVPNLTVRTAAKPVDGQSVVASSESPETDAILNAGLQAARGQLSQRQ
jgi:carboxyl-terminal processing protease